jgi:acetyl esterase/lipase
VQITDGIIYGTAPISTPPGDVDLLLDLYEPVGADAPYIRPGFVIIHGGGFTGGSRKGEEYITLATEMAARGYSAISIDYRLKDQTPVLSEEFKPFFKALKQIGIGQKMARAIAAAAEDATRAHRWMVENAGLLKVDIHRIAVGGTSAGAITSMMLGYVLDDHGVIDVPEIGVILDKSGELWGFKDCMESVESPLFIAHGEEDDLFDISTAEAIAEKANEVGIPCEFYPIPEAGHEFDMFTIEVAPGVTVFDKVVQFFFEQLLLADLIVEMAIHTLVDSVDAINNLDPSHLKNKNHKKALKNKINAVLKMVNTENYVGARNKLLNDILKKMDGCAKTGYPDNNDWIITPEGQDQVYPLILKTIGFLDSLVDQNCNQGNDPFLDIRLWFELCGWWNGPAAP